MIYWIIVDVLLKKREESEEACVRIETLEKRVKRVVNLARNYRGIKANELKEKILNRLRDRCSDSAYREVESIIEEIISNAKYPINTYK